MNRRSAFTLLLAVALVLPTPAWAQGNGNRNNGNGNGNNGNGNNAGGNGNGNGNNGNGNNGNGNGNNAGGNGNGKSQDSDTVTPENGDTTTGDSELSESEVLAAVQAGNAVSLQTILPDIRTRTGGEIINAKLQVAKGFLLYGVTVLTPEGKVVTEYYYARSGLHVGN